MIFYIFKRLGCMQIKKRNCIFEGKIFCCFFLKRNDSFNTEKAPRV